MRTPTFLAHLGKAGRWPRDLALALLALAAGFGLMPLVIFYSGSLALGKYEGASLGNLYTSVYRGLGSGSAASWIVVLGPGAFYILFKVFGRWWRWGTQTV